MKKLTKEEIESIKELIKIKTSREIAKLFNVSQNAIIYWTTNREKILKRNIERYRKKSKEEKKRICEKQREYQKVYHRKGVLSIRGLNSGVNRSVFYKYCFNSSNP
jgi:prenyltransferase beta subunit